MKSFQRIIMLAPLAAAICLSGCASTSPGNEVTDLSGLGLFDGPPKDIDQRIARAAKHPLGSKENPVRVNMPQGEYRYLMRLRCKDGGPPKFERLGSYGSGPYGNIIDGYDVKCEGSEPAQSLIFMDMYFPTHKENQAPEGFTITP